MLQSPHNLRVYGSPSLELPGLTLQSTDATWNLVTSVTSISLVITPMRSQRFPHNFFIIHFTCIVFILVYAIYVCMY